MLPLINAAFGLLSIGLTRWLIGIGGRHGRWAIVLGLVDLLAAGLAFTLTLRRLARRSALGSGSQSLDEF
ncbi:MAG: hypothetical protein GVY28_12290 [Alphaproteobacteria bacterium]|nr:hypothetical protein [Alphaproteobacteria bacterium]